VTRSTRRSRISSSATLAAASGLAVIASLATAPEVHAQQNTFHLDRLEVPGGPEDGISIYRPVQDPGFNFYAQLAVGYARRPLHTSDITSDPQVQQRSSGGVINNQYSTYANIGFQFLDRFSVGAALPIAWGQNGDVPNYSTLGGNGNTSAFNTGGPAVGDIRLDARAILLQTKDRRGALGVQGSFNVPSGTQSNFGSDNSVTGTLMVTGEYKLGPVALDANTGFNFRPDAIINDPVHGNGLGIGDEWRWAVGAFVPFKNEKFRLGATIFGSTGLQGSSSSTGNTVFTHQNTPLEWQVEGRMRLGAKQRWWIGLGAGSLINEGYGAPDFRVVGLAGFYVPILDTSAPSPPEHRRVRPTHDEGMKDSDHDGIPDDIDACPDQPEDHQGESPEDGCPLPPDRDGDGIPDSMDKCPDQPEDKDGVDDEDGCPETDADQDGIPDVKDACPKEPGKPNRDPKQNGCPSFIRMEGNEVRVLKQVHFATGKATILPDSFPILQEVADLLKANPQITRMSVEGHTDDRGSNEMNLKLSQGRTESVVRWLTEHGIAGSRLEAHGFGEEKPIEDNKTEEGRTANRRVEFKIVNEGGK
jgi:OOP family OmpA-OmpF porin